MHPIQPGGELLKIQIPLLLICGGSTSKIPQDKLAEVIDTVWTAHHTRRCWSLRPPHSPGKIHCCGARLPHGAVGVSPTTERLDFPLSDPIDGVALAAAELPQDLGAATAAPTPAAPPHRWRLPSPTAGPQSSPPPPAGRHGTAGSIRHTEAGT